mmetsp:Transcript_101975/g.181134  ORF Transcript_101975/g.181134 Transcript_101975/m.181134 type:complete len:236 (-) Transcript_101975:247-954(-)
MARTIAILLAAFATSAWAGSHGMQAMDNMTNDTMVVVDETTTTTTDQPPSPSPSPSPTPTTPPKEETVVTGTATLEVDDPAAFVADPKAKEGVQTAIAEMANVPTSAVEVTLSVGSARRLEARKLQDSSVVIVTYEIKVASATVGATLVDSVKEWEPATLATAITTAITEAGGDTYVVTVTEIASPEVTTVTVDPSPSTSPPGKDEPPKTDESGSHRGSQACIIGVGLLLMQFSA